MMLDNHKLPKTVSKAFQTSCVPIFDVAENVNHLLSKNFREAEVIEWSVRAAGCQLLGGLLQGWQDAWQAGLEGR